MQTKATIEKFRPRKLRTRTQIDPRRRAHVERRQVRLERLATIAGAARS